MSSPALPSCPHELRPGTTVCLHCRRDARASTQAKLQRTVLVSVVAVGCVGAAVAGLASGSAAFPSRRAAVGSEPVAVDAPAVRTATHGVAAPIEPSLTAPPSAADARFTVRIAEGRTRLPGRDAYAVRSGDVVTVTFDGIMSRTRRPDKFERIVRATLPQVYGDGAAAVLASVRPGTLVSASALTGELPVRGLRLAHPDGGALTLWPETRPGRDGPLVVAYRVTATP